MASNRLLACKLAQATCGVITQFLAVSNGLSAEGGSALNTSSPAPAIVPWVKASASACSSTRGPRPVFIRTAELFIFCKRSALTTLSVSGVNGQFNDKKSARAKTSSTGNHSTS